MQSIFNSTAQTSLLALQLQTELEAKATTNNGLHVMVRAGQDSTMILLTTLAEMAKANRQQVVQSFGEQLTDRVINYVKNLQTGGVVKSSTL